MKLNKQVSLTNKNNNEWLKAQTKLKDKKNVEMLEEKQEFSSVVMV